MHRVPLPGSTMLIGMFGFMITAYYTALGKLDKTWGFTFIVFFLILFIASVVSITPSLSKET
ncbi:MAG TPA: hypothetical protein VJB90_05745 [Candidatus Nanoarchaeia archaeon]|nr:hypothetical protein [Candidatus Nanoarchaeia archaeon]